LEPYEKGTTTLENPAKDKSCSYQDSGVVPQDCGISENERISSNLNMEGKISALPSNTGGSGGEKAFNSTLRRGSTFRRYPKSREQVIAEAPSLVQKGRVSVIPTIENMSKLVMESIKVESTGNQAEIITFLSELPDQEKNTHKGNIFKTYMDLISLSFFKTITQNEAANTASMLVEVAKLTHKSIDLISYLIILTQAPNDLPRYFTS
jgi:hypothetical protein